MGHFCVSSIVKVHHAVDHYYHYHSGCYDLCAGDYKAAYVVHNSCLQILPDYSFLVII